MDAAEAQSRAAALDGAVVTDVLGVISRQDGGCPVRGAPGGLRLDLLEAFVVLATDLHFGRAASRLFLSQPGLSRRITSLEGLFGEALLHRTTRAVELSPAGEALLPHARAVLAAAQAAAVAVQSANRNLSHSSSQPTSWSGGPR